MLYAIRLTLTNDQPVYVTLKHISSVEITENFDTVVTMTNGDRFSVQESAEDAVSHFTIPRI